MDIAEKIYHKVKRLPQGMAEQVLDYVERLETQQALTGLTVATDRPAQTDAMEPVRENPNDPVWDDLLFR